MDTVENKVIDIICADSYEWLKTQPNNSFDHVITDYPYGTEFPFTELLRVTKGNIITFCSETDYPFKPTERAYWIKTPSTKNYIKRLGRFVEHIFIYRQGEVFNCLHWSQMTGVYTDLVEDADGHQYRKPMSLMERLVRIYTNPGEVVLDPFCGSGTTLEAAEKRGRNSVGVDVDEYYVNECRERLGNYTQEKTAY